MTGQATSRSVALSRRLFPGGRAAILLLAAACTDHPGEPVPELDAGAPDGCVGPRPADAAWLADAGPLSGDGGETAGEPRVGDPAPSWALRDFQPQSCGYGAVYGLEAFRGHATVLSLLSAS